MSQNVSHCVSAACHAGLQCSLDADASPGTWKQLFRQRTPRKENQSGPRKALFGRAPRAGKDTLACEAALMSPQSLFQSVAAGTKAAEVRSEYCCIGKLALAPTRPPLVTGPRVICGGVADCSCAFTPGLRGACKAD